MFALLVALQVCPGGGECIPLHPPPPPHGPNISITYTTFIPLDHIRLAAPLSDYFYEADNQPSYQQGVSTYRVTQNVTVSTGQGIIAAPAAVSAISRVYDSDAQPANLTTQADCYRKHCPNCPAYTFPVTSPITFQGQCLIRTATPLDAGEAEDMITVTAQLVEVGFTDGNTNYVKIRLRGSPKIGVSPYGWAQAISPAIDWDVTITLTRSTVTGTSYQITGSHDGFPYHVIHIGATQVMQRDPIPNGNTPLALYPGSSIPVSVGGNL